MKNTILNSNSKITDCTVTNYLDYYEIIIYYNYVLDNETDVNKGQQYFFGTNADKIVKEINKYLNKKHKHLTILDNNPIKQMQDILERNNVKVEPYGTSDFEEDEVIGTTGPIVDLFNAELTNEEWNAIAVVHKLSNRLNLGIKFQYQKSIDVKSVDASQIVDESVFNNRV
jgi:hypothetical protein